MDYGKLSVEDEFPIGRLPDNMPLWSENYCFDGYDPDAGIGFWIHMGRSSQHPLIWREHIDIMLPNDEFLIKRNYGTLCMERGNVGGAASMSYNCDVPFEKWRLGHFGAVRHVNRAQLLKGALPDGKDALLEFEFTFTGTTPIWDFAGKVENQIWCNQHYEQAGLLGGWFKFKGEKKNLKGFSYRDHSRGVRDLGKMNQHVWVHGTFPDGRSFGTFEFLGIDASVPNLSEGFAIIDGKMYDAKIAHAPELKSLDDAYKPYEMVLKGSFGEWHLKGVPQNSMVQSFARPNEHFFGIAHGVASHVTFQESARFRLDGMDGIGHTERTIRIA